MLDIPTAKPKYQTWQAGRNATPAGGVESETTAGPPGMTSMAPQTPTAYAGTTPYAYAGQGWNDPVAQSVMKDYFSGPRWDTGSAPGMYDQNMNIAQAYNDTPGVLHSPLDPASWGTTYRGQEFADVADKYKAAGGTYYNQFTPAQQAGVPYYAATGEAAPVMNMQTGVAENPLTGAAAPVGGTGSYHSVAPGVLNKMWR